MLAIAASAAVTGLAARAVVESESVFVDFGSLAEDMLAVQDSLQAFLQADHGPAETVPSENSMAEQRVPRLRPGTAPVPATEWSGSSCSSISFTKGAGTPPLCCSRQA